MKGIDVTTMRMSTCEECGTPQLARNTWFTGKLLTERDLTDERLGLLRLSAVRPWRSDRLTSLEVLAASTEVTKAVG